MSTEPTSTKWFGCTVPLNNAKNSGSKWSLNSDWFVWLMYLCHSVEKEGTVIQAWFRFQSARPPSRHPCPLTLLPIPFPLSWSVSLFTPPLPGPTCSQSTVKFTESQVPLGISVSICIFVRCALCIGLCGGMWARKALRLLLCQCEESSGAQWTVGVQTEHLFVGPRFVDTVTQCV